MEQGGVERGVAEVNRILVGAGWQNVVVSSGGRMAASIEADGGRHVPLDVKSKNPLTYFSRAAKLRGLLERERPDVVCAHSRVPAWLFLWANRTLHLPWISFPHGANSVSPYSKVMTFGDLVVTPSVYIADHLRRAYGLDESRLRVIPRAIDRARFDPSRLDGGFIADKRAQWGLDGRYVVMGLGRITQLKGYDTLIRATAMAARDIPGIKTVIVGEAERLRRDVERDLRRLVADLGLEDRVVFAGHQSLAAECLSMADVVVSANTCKPEAFGRSMAEALAMDRPVVAAAFGGALDIVEDGVNGALVDPKSGAEGFAAAIVRVSKVRFGDLRKPALEKFSFEKMAEATLSAYRELSSAAAKRIP